MTPPTAALPIALYERLRNAQRCPNCPDQGWYVVANRNTGEPEQEQCEFCCTVADSLFNVIESARAPAVQEPKPVAWMLKNIPSLSDDRIAFSLKDPASDSWIPLFASTIPYTQADYDRNAIKVPADVKITFPSIGEPELGWVMVPREPTAEMQEAGYIAAVSAGQMRHTTPTFIWEKMLSAAPKVTE